MNAYAFEELTCTACFVLVTVKCYKHGDVHIGNVRIQRGAGSLEPSEKQRVLYVSIEKCNLGWTP